MHQSVESDSVHGHGKEGASADARTRQEEPTTEAAQEWRQRNAGGGMRRSSSDTTVVGTMFGFIQQHPVVATGAALAVGAAVAMAMTSRRPNYKRLDRQALKAARSMERTFAREMRNLRHSDMADRMSRFGSSLGDAFSRVDLSPLAERGRTYLEAARSRFGRM